MAISAAMVKELRERTGAGMMDCKKALTETNGDIERGIELLRKIGAASAEKRAGRIVTEGVVVQMVSDNRAYGVMVEVNCETDFVAKDETFQRFAKGVAQCVLASDPATDEALLECDIGDGKSVGEARQELIARIGENITIRRFDTLKSGGGMVAGYLHGGRIGVLVSLENGNREIGKGIAMHVAAGKPLCIDEAGVPQNVLDAERSIFIAQAKESGKSDEIVERIVEGRIRKFLKENTLLGQAYVKDLNITVGELVDNNKATIKAMLRYEVGEGLEKRSDDFVTEVMMQANRG